MSTPNTTIARLSTALAAMSSPKADKVNPAFRSKYASLCEMLDHVRPILAKQGLGITQFLTSADGRVGVRTSVAGPEGTLDLSDISVSVKPDTTAQQVGSSITYLRRQSLQAALGIATDTDDDGAAASQPAAPARTWKREEAK